MSGENEIAWIDAKNKFYTIEESIKQTHTYIKCNYKQSGCSCRILDVYGGILFASAACMFFAAYYFRIAEDREDQDTEHEKQ